MQALGLTNGAAQSAVTGVQQPAPAAPTVRPDGAPLPKPGLVTLPATAAGAAAAQAVVLSLPAPRGGPMRQPDAAAGRPVSAGALAEAKGRTAIAEQVEKGMRQHFPGMSDETLAQWHSNLEGTLAEAQAAHSIAKDNIKQVSLHAPGGASCTMLTSYTSSSNSHGAGTDFISLHPCACSTQAELH